MPNLSNCSKCNSKMIHGGIDNSTGELLCGETKIVNLNDILAQYQIKELYLLKITPDLQEVVVPDDRRERRRGSSNKN